MGTQTQEKIENPWCTYGYLTPWGIGRIEADHGNTVLITKYENQHYGPD